MELTNLYHMPHTSDLNKGTIIDNKNAEFLQKNAGISIIKEVLVVKSIFSETTYLCVLTYQISSF